jgi:Tol biopolymer transport system component
MANTSYLRIVAALVGAALAGCLILWLGASRPAQAAFPGENGKIAFLSGGNSGGLLDIFVMDPDGSCRTNLTKSGNNLDPAWSSDGTKIAFVHASDIFVMNADGSKQTQLTKDPPNAAATDDQPAFSPDGSKIAFRSNKDGDDEIYVMNSDGSNQINLTNNSVQDHQPVFSPDGSKIAFTRNAEIFVMNADGSNQTNLTNTPIPTFEGQPNWSPDGSKIAFTRGSQPNGEVYVMNADGSNQTNLTNTAGNDEEPAWSPDATKIAFRSNRDDPTIVESRIYVMNADGSKQTDISNNSNDFRPDWGVAGNRPPNTSPVAKDDSYSASEDTALTVSAANGVLVNDTDTECDTLTAIEVSGPDPDKGTLTLNSDGSFTYTPNAGFSGTDTFTYKANDGSLDSNVATVTLTVKDTSAPTVSSVVPVDSSGREQTAYTPTTNIKVTFSEKMEETTLNGDTVKLVKPGKKPTFIPVTMTKSTDSNGRTVLILNPYGSNKQNLAANTTYNLTIQGTVDTDGVVGFVVKDMAGNPLAQDAPSSFTTRK